MDAKDIPDWAKRRAYELAYGDQDRFDDPKSWMFSNRTAQAFASYIAQHEQPPVDPDLEAAREVIARAYKDPGTSEAILNGKWDRGAFVEVALAAIKRGKELANGGAA